MDSYELDQYVFPISATVINNNGVEDMFTVGQEVTVVSGIRHVIQHEDLNLNVYQVQCYDGNLRNIHGFRLQPRRSDNALRNWIENAIPRPTVKH